MSQYRKMFFLILFLALFVAPHIAKASPLAFAAPIPFPEGEGPDGIKYKTAYRCEGEEMSISCDSTETIQVIRANYGRFSIAICNKHGYTDWSVNCMSPRTTRILQNKCDGKKTCRMNVNSDIFGDPCPGTHKYVEVHYACSPQFTTTTTRRPLPPWFLENGADNLWINPKISNNNNNEPATSRSSVETTESKSTSTLASPPTTSTTSTTSEQEAKNIFSISASSAAAANVGQGLKRKPILVTGSDAITASTTPIRIPITTPRPTTTTTTTARPTTSKTTTTTSTTATTTTIGERTKELNQNRPVIDLRPIEDETSIVIDSNIEVHVESEQQPIALLPDFCPQISARGINWNWTRSGDVAIVPCPNGATGLARWSCLEDGRWSAASVHTPAHPDLSDCKSASMTNLEARVREEDPEDVVVSTLAHLTTKMTGRMFGGDLESAVAILRTVANRLQYLLQTQSDSFYNKESYVQQVFQNVLRSASNLLSEENRSTWIDLHPSQRMKTATALLLALEENAFLLAEVTNAPEIIEETSSSIVMAISILDVQYISRSNGTSFPHIKPDASSSSNSGKYVRNNNNNDEAENWIKWSESNSVHLSSKSLLDHSNDGTLTKAVFFAHGQLHHILRDAEKHLQTADSSTHILNSLIISASLGNGRHIQLPSPVRVTLGHLIQNFTDPICAFWDYELNGWSDAGCRSVLDDDVTRDDVTICECDHLTNFALLMRSSVSDRATGASLSNGASPIDRSTVQVLEIVTYVAVALSIIFLAVIIYRYHSKIHRLLLKYNCMANSNSLNKKTQDKGMDGCAKSQSFYSGMNHVAINNVSTTTTTTTTAATASPADSSRVRNSKPTFYYNCCHQQPISCSTSPSASVASTVSLCPSHLLTNEAGHPHFVQIHTSRLLSAPHLSLQHWVPPREVPTSLPPLPCPYIYSSAYEFEPSQALSQYLVRQELGRNFVNNLSQDGQDVEDEVANYQPYLCLNENTGGHITANPYDDLRSRESLSPPDGMLATQHLRDTVYMSSQLANLTNTLRGSTNKKKMVCQGGHSAGPCQHEELPQQQQDDDFVFRAVSPHGHVYWEIDPTRIDKLKADPPQKQPEFILNSMSRQSSSRYSDNYPLITNSPAKSDISNNQEATASAETMILVNPFADVQLISINGSPISQNVRPINDVRFSSLRGNYKQQMQQRPLPPQYQHLGTRASSARNARMKDVANNVDQWRIAQTGNGSLSSSDGSCNGHPISGSSSSTSPTSQVLEQVQQQVQIKDLRSIPVSVKSTDYILAKIHNQLGRGSPNNTNVGNILNRTSPKQRKV